MFDFMNQKTIMIEASVAPESTGNNELFSLAQYQENISMVCWKRVTLGAYML